MIDVTYGKIEKVISKLNAMSNIPSNCNYNTSFITGDLLTHYRSLNDQVKEKLNNLELAINSLETAASYSLKLLKDTEEDDYDDLKKLIDEIFNVTPDYLTNGDGVFDENEFYDLILNHAFNNATELPPVILKNIINNCEYLTEEDKEYLFEQLGKGNVRSSICHIIVLHEKQKLNIIEEKNEPYSRDYNTEIPIISELLNSPVFNEGNKDWCKVEYNGKEYTYSELYALFQEYSRVKKEIEDQKRIIRIYETSQKEWEYDYVLRLSGTEDFENTVTINDDRDFYVDTLTHYYNGHNFTDADNDYFNYENFYMTTLFWLNSDDCDLSEEKKAAYLERLKTMPVNSVSTDDNYPLYLASEYLINNGFDNDRYLALYEKNAFRTIDGVPILSKAFRYFDEDHIKVYDYILKTEGQEAADRYLETFSDSLERASGMEKADAIFNSIVNGANAEYVLGLGLANYEGIKIGTEEWFDVLGQIGSTTGNYTDSEYAILYVNQMLEGAKYIVNLNENDLNGLQNNMDENTYNRMIYRVRNGEKVTLADVLYETGSIDDSSYQMIIDMNNNPNIIEFSNKINTDGKFLGKDKVQWLEQSFNTGVSVGNAIPSIVATYLTSGAAGALGMSSTAAASLGQNVGLSLMFLNNFAGTKNEQLRDHRELFDASLYSFLSSGSKTLLTKYLGGIPGLSNVSKWTQLTPTSKTSNIVIKSLLDLFVVSPGKQVINAEVQQYGLKPLLDYSFYGETDVNFSTEAALDLALSSALSSLELQVLTSPNKIKNASDMIKLSKQTVGYIRVNGEPVELTYGELCDAMDKETGQIDEAKVLKTVFTKATKPILQKVIEKYGLEADLEFLNDYEFVNDDEWKVRFPEREHADGFVDKNTGNTYIRMTTGTSGNNMSLLERLIHEGLHHLGWLIDDDMVANDIWMVGLEESIVETYAQQLARENRGSFEGEPALGYKIGVESLGKITNANIPGLGFEDFASELFHTHEIGRTSETMNQIIENSGKRSSVNYGYLYAGHLMNICNPNGVSPEEIAKIDKYTNNLINAFNNTQK